MSWPESFAEWAGQAGRVVYWSVYGRLRRISQPDGRSRLVAEEATQTALLRAAERKDRDHFPEYAAFLAWLNVVAWHEAIRLNRQDLGRERRTVPMDPDWCGEATRQADDLTDLRECVEKLDADDQRIVMLRFTDGLGFKEIAARLGIGTTSAFTRIRRALDRLRDCLSAGELP